MPDYPGPSLPSQTRSIRLLSLDLGKNDNLSGSLETFQLNHAPGFVALSYAWGSSEGQRTMSLDRQAFNIRRNLWAALMTISKLVRSGRYLKLSTGLHDPDTDSEDQAMRTEPGPWKWFWIDAICINQADLDEKAQQVSMMGQIYSRAGLVLAWLGAGDHTVLDALHVIESFGAHSYNADPWQRILASSKRHDGRRCRIDGNKFLELEYFHRLWIVQEFALAQNLVLLYGGHALDGDQLARFIDTDQDYDDQYRTFAERVVRARLSWQNVLRLTASQPFDHLINVYAEHSCSDPRDRIFGLLGLISEHEYPGLRADYTISPLELHRQVIEAVSPSKRFQAKHSAAGSNTIRFIDRIYAALHIPEQFRKTKILWSALDGYEHRDFWDLQPGAVFKRWRKLNEEVNWQRIQDLDWTAMKSWGQNYESLQTDFHVPAP
jgi:hypothetical protein